MEQDKEISKGYVVAVIVMIVSVIAGAFTASHWLAGNQILPVPTGKEAKMVAHLKSQYGERLESLSLERIYANGILAPKKPACSKKTCIILDSFNYSHYVGIHAENTAKDEHQFIWHASDIRSVELRKTFTGHWRINIRGVEWENLNPDLLAGHLEQLVEMTIEAKEKKVSEANEIAALWDRPIKPRRVFTPKDEDQSIDVDDREEADTTS